MLILAGLLAASPAPGAGAAPSGVAELARGQRAFRAGGYEEAARILDQPLAARLPLNRDYVLYLGAESAFYAGSYGSARALFSQVAKVKASRFAAIASWRVADCLWAEGERRAAGARYRNLLKTRASGVDPVVARFRLAELAAGSEAQRMFRAVHLEFPSHPLAEEAARRAAVPGPPPSASASPAQTSVPASDRLRRAAVLADGRHYREAREELEQLPTDLPPELRPERDYLLGQVLYRMRRQYPMAGALLLGAAPHLHGEKQVWAAFHGARALSRADRDDEAITGYGRVVEKFPRSRWAAEAQFLSGWLDFNRGRYQESLGRLESTLDRFGQSPFAADAAWCLAFAHFLLDQPQEAARALERYARLARATSGDSDAAKRVLYWRARIHAKAGRGAEARADLRECVRRWPLSHYGLLARARLEAAGEKPAMALAARAVVLGPLEPDTLPILRDPAVARADQLLAAGMVEDAGVELGRGEAGLFKRYGQEQTLAVLFDRYPRMRAFRRAYQLAEVRGAPALEGSPEGAARVVWEAAYPRAFFELVEAHGAAAGNPELLLYAIMRKESGFSPDEVSYADARGLLQMIPATSQRLAARAGQPFFADELYLPDVNVRLGAAYIGGLYKRFRQQVALTAGAYNAGAAAMMRWCDQHGHRPLDEFVELIAYEQTREYVKRVVGIYARYRFLYTKKPFALPLTVNAQYEKGGAEKGGSDD